MSLTGGKREVKRERGGLRGRVGLDFERCSLVTSVEQHENIGFVSKTIKNSGSSMQRIPEGQKYPYTRWEGTPLWQAIDKAVCDLIQNRDLVEDEFHEYVVGYICKIIDRRKKAVIAQLQADDGEVLKGPKQLPSQTRTSRSTFSDHVWKLYKRRRVSLTVKVLPEKKREGLPAILLEGNRASLEWLADSILAQAGDQRDCSSFFGPDGPGYRFFNKKDSEFGFYIHRLPCLEEAARKSWKAKGKAGRMQPSSRVKAVLGR